jgi:formylmethanofuran dehydrogenase subunit E
MAKSEQFATKKFSTSSLKSLSKTVAIAKQKKQMNTESEVKRQAIILKKRGLSIEEIALETDYPERFISFLLGLEIKCTKCEKELDSANCFPNTKEILCFRCSLQDIITRRLSRQTCQEIADEYSVSKQAINKRLKVLRRTIG